ncbi:MAG: DUF3298 and DUF4163 domain-containing protein [Sarcina sp.]
MFKKLTLIFLSVLFSFSIISTIAIGKENTVEIYDKIINKENQYIKVSARLPIVKIPNSIVGENLTKKINNRLDETLVDLMSLAEQEKADKTGSGNLYELDSLYEVPYNQNNILSLYTLDYQFTGGAHGITTLVPYNINISNGKYLTLNNLFKKEFNYIEFINNKVNEKIKENPDIYFLDGENKFKTISEKQDFYINEKGIVIVFQLYEIAPYSSGIQHILIPKEEIVDKLINNKIW